MINKPQPDEYASFYSTYVKLVEDGTDVLALLEELKGSGYNLFSNMDVAKAGHAYAEGKWTIKQLLGHMIDAERVFAYRVLCFSRGERELPGFGELMRAKSLEQTTTAILSRQTAAHRGACLIVNLPGSPRSIDLCLSAVFAAIPYCVDLIGGAFLDTHPEMVKTIRPGAKTPN